MIFRGGENSTGELGNFHPALTFWIVWRALMLETRVLEPLENRFGPKVLPMS
jgi:hypothetical protein